jgi:hypothetical protein
MYYASTEEFYTIAYFLQLQDIVVEPIFIKYLDVDVLLSISLAKYSFEYATSVKLLFFL